MLMAPQVVALAFVSASGPSSPLLLALGLAPAPGTPNPLLGAGGISLILGLHLAPLAFVILRTGLRQLPRELIEAAALDGASRVGVLRHVVLPLLRGHIAAAGLLAFVAALGNFGIPALLGLPVNYLTLPTLDLSAPVEPRPHGHLGGFGARYADGAARRPRGDPGAPDRGKARPAARAGGGCRGIVAAWAMAMALMGAVSPFSSA